MKKDLHSLKIAARLAAEKAMEARSQFDAADSSATRLAKLALNFRERANKMTEDALKASESLEGFRKKVIGAEAELAEAKAKVAEAEAVKLAEAKATEAKATEAKAAEAKAAEAAAGRLRKKATPAPPPPEEEVLAEVLAELGI